MRLTLPSGTPVEVAGPDGSPARGVVMYPDIFGLRPLFDELAARLAEEHAWAVAVVEPFPGRRLPDIDARFAAVPELHDGPLLADALSAAAALRERGARRVAVMGFCMGGMYTLKAAASGSFDGAVSFYGMIRLPPAWQGPGQAEPLTLLEGAARVTPTLAIVGGRDPYTPPDDVAALAACAGVDVARYADAEHGFVHDAQRRAHRPGDAADAWRRAVTFLDEGISAPDARAALDR